MRRLSSITNNVLVAGVLLATFASSAFAAEEFTITATFSATETFALGELVALVEKCVATDFSAPATSTDLKVQCIEGLISTSAVCSTIGSDFMCTINGVQINTADINFACDASGCPTTDATIDAALTGLTCGTPASKSGFVGNCYDSAYCLYDSGDPFTHFGEFCPTSTGEYCCGDTISRDTGYFPGGDTVTGTNLPDGTTDFLRRVDHVVDMNFDIVYTVDAPAKLKIEVEVPYVTSASTVTYVEDGLSKDYPMCPSTYLIDFEAPIETYPQASETPNRVESQWLPLQHFPTSDKVGRPRSSCGNYDMTYTDEASFKAGFKYADDGSNTLTYGTVPAVDATVWDPSVSTSGIPNGADTLWKKSSPIGLRVNYTSGFFDLVKTYYECKDYHSNTRLVTEVPEPEPSYVNGVAYPVKTYEWTLTVCQVGFFGLGCADVSRTQMYAKTCAKIPASFSISPQQVSHVAVTPVSETIVSKTFLQSVTSVSSTCSTGSERVVLTLNLVLVSTDYAMIEEESHDLVSPSGILDVPEEDFNITSKAYTSTEAFLNAEPNVASGVYKLDLMDLSTVATGVRYRKIVIVTKCYDTGYDSVEGTRATPAVFADDVANGVPNVLVDVEVVVKKTVGSQTGDVKNTLNLRVLATKESLVLQSEDKLRQKDVTAYLKLYGSYEIAKMDTAVNLPNALPANAKMSGGDQICSKHQIQEDDAQVSNLSPNAVGACMLTTYGETFADGAGTLMMGRSIKYRLGIGLPINDYTFGCFQDWVDVSGLTPVDGVYVITDQRPRLTGTHDSMFWFVQKEKLSTQALPGIGETLDSRFGTGLFYYNSTAGTYVVTKSSQMQLDKATKQLDLTAAAQNSPGCVQTPGNLRSACNLVCFDLVDGLLTDPAGASERQVLVHHYSVATIATAEQSTTAKKFGGVKHRRVLLESATSTRRILQTSEPSKTSVTMAGVLGVSPGPMTVNLTNDADGRDPDGPKDIALAVLLPVSFIAIASVFGVVACNLIWYKNTDGFQLKNNPLSLSKFRPRFGTERDRLGSYRPLPGEPGK